ncbi:MAG: TIGR03808 family TAT-translocated repetitive protein [Devosia sp.]
MSGHIFTRRRILGGLAAGLAMPAIITAARAAQPIDAVGDFGLDPNDQSDQSSKLQAAFDAAASDGRLLLLPGGHAGFAVSRLNIPSGLHVIGLQTILTTPGDARLAAISGAFSATIEGIVFQANAPETAAGVNGLIEIENSSGISFRKCGFLNAAGNGIAANDSALSIEGCDFEGATAAAIHSQNGRNVIIRGNRISSADNAGIRIWRDDPGPDGSIITGNQISKIDWTDGGNGQNGNGVSIYRADEVIVADNRISDCAFSAVRINTGKNCQIRGNVCIGSGEVAIFSEFAFSGSVIADNIIDGAAQGISITNLDQGGHLATCTGNIVRNIAPRSANNPDTQPVGIYAEADTVVSGNTVDTVPGAGIVAGFGPYVRNLVVADNLVTNAMIGIAVSVVQQQSPGPVRVSGNLVSGAQQGIVGMEWDKVVSQDLTKEAGRYPNVTVDGNTVS